MTYTYRPEILDELASHGIRPCETTDPQRVRDYLSDLYRHEPRRLRAGVLKGEFPKAELVARVIALRKRYRLMSVPVQDWTR